MQIILMGAPGAGKGTQAAKLVEKLGLVHISTGDLFRAEAQRPTERGNQIYWKMRNGQLIEDEITNALIEERLLQETDVRDGNFILDGYPRTTNQAIHLDVILSWAKLKVTHAINIAVPSEYLIERAVGRRICRKCGATYHVKFNPPNGEVCDICGGELYQRADDNEQTMRNRLSAYEASTRPLIDYYKSAGVYMEIDGRQPIDKVTEDLLHVLSSVKD